IDEEELQNQRSATYQLEVHGSRYVQPAVTGLQAHRRQDDAKHEPHRHRDDSDLDGDQEPLQQARKPADNFTHVNSFQGAASHRPILLCCPFRARPPSGPERKTPQLALRKLAAGTSPFCSMILAAEPSAFISFHTVLKRLTNCGSLLTTGRQSPVPDLGCVSARPARTSYLSDGSCFRKY